MNSKLRDSIIFVAAVISLVVFFYQVPSRDAFQVLEDEVGVLRTQVNLHQGVLAQVMPALAYSIGEGARRLQAPTQMAQAAPSLPPLGIAGAPGGLSSPTSSTEESDEALRKVVAGDAGLITGRAQPGLVAPPGLIGVPKETLAVPSKEEFEVLKQEVETLRATLAKPPSQELVQVLEQQLKTLGAQLAEEQGRLTQTQQAHLTDTEALKRSFLALEESLKQEWAQNAQTLSDQLARQQEELVNLRSVQASIPDTEAIQRAFQALEQDLRQEFAKQVEALHTQLTQQQASLAQLAAAHTEAVEEKALKEQALQALTQDVQALHTQLTQQRSASDKLVQDLQQQVHILHAQLAKPQETPAQRIIVKADSAREEALTQELQALQKEVKTLRAQLTKQRKQLAQLTTSQADATVASGLSSPWYAQVAQASLSAWPRIMWRPGARPAPPLTKETIGVAQTGKDQPLSSAPIKVAKATSSTPKNKRATTRPAPTGNGAASYRKPIQLAQAISSTPPGVVGPPGARPGIAPEDQEGKIRIAPTIEKGGLLLRRGQWQVEPSLSYSHISKNRVGLTGFSIFDVIFIGQIRSEEIDRDILVPAMSLRYGLTNTLEVETKLPLQYRRDEELKGPIENRRKSVTDAFGLSDIEGGFYYHFAQEQGMRPHLIANVKVKAPTGDTPMLGSGYWGVKSGLTMVKTSDPVVLFSNLAYYMNFPTDIEGRRVNPGDSFELGFGLAYALNYNLSLNGAFEQLFVTETTASGSQVNGSRLTIANLKAGLTWALSRRLSLDFSVGAGLTEDSPDLTVYFSVPYTF